MFIKNFLIVIATSLVAINSVSGAEMPQKPSTEQPEQKAHAPERIVLPETKGRSMILFGGGVGINKPKPPPKKSEVMQCRDYDARIAVMVSPTNSNSSCD